MKIHVFNSGRQYTKEGQRIAWTVVQEGTDENGFSFWLVEFNDADRMVYGRITIDFCAPTNDDVMREYDACRYVCRPLLGDDYSAYHATHDALKAYALENAPVL